jgi:phosphonate transport system substrate-binding protein
MKRNKLRKSLRTGLLSGLGALCLSVLLAGCGGGDEGSGAAEATLERVVVALKPDKDPDAMLEERRALGSWLEGALQRPVEVIVPASGAVIEQGLANGTIDLAWVSSTSLARYREAGVADLLVAGEIDGRTWYQSYWVTLQEKPYAAIEDLEGEPICFASPTSTSGYIIPTYDLFKRGLITQERGPEVFFGKGNVLYGTGYVSAIQRVFNGQAEAAAVSDYVMDEDRHLTPEEKARLKIVQAQGPVPTHCMALRSGIDPAEQALLRKAVLELNTENPELRDRVFGSILKEVDPDAHLDSIQRALSFVRGLNAP